MHGHLEVIVLSFLFEVAQLSEVIVDHYNFVDFGLLLIRNKDGSILLLTAWIELLLNPHSCVLSLAYLSVGIDDVRKVA